MVLVLVPHINGTEKLVLGLVLPKKFPVLVLVSVLQIKLGFVQPGLELTINSW
jgi:hypothetical protein